MTTGTFHPDTGTEDPGDVGSAPDPEFGEEAGEEGGEWQWPVEGEVWPALAGLEEMEGEEGEPAEGEEPTLPPTDPSLPPTPPTYLPYEITVTDYCGNYIYENSKLSRLLFDGGFMTFPYVLVPSSSNGDPQLTADLSNPEYHHYFTDHLGSVRVVTDDQGNIEQTNNYYPYGGLMASSSCITDPSSSTVANQPNRYNGKELDRRNALDWFDYSARHYDGNTWRNVDELTEKYPSWSPYIYCIGNPIKYIDPTGKIIEDANGMIARYKINILQYIYQIESSQTNKETKQIMMTFFQDRWNEISLLESSKQIYHFYSDVNYSSGSYYNDKDDKIMININLKNNIEEIYQIGLIGHEIYHGVQYERGELSYSTSSNRMNGTLYDLSDETSAYNIERAFYYGIIFFEDPNSRDAKGRPYKFQNNDTKSFGNDMTPPAYQDLPNGPISINSMEGILLRIGTFCRGLLGKGINDYYNGWQNDYYRK